MAGHTANGITAELETAGVEGWCNDFKAVHCRRCRPPAIGIAYRKRLIDGIEALAQATPIGIARLGWRWGWGRRWGRLGAGAALFAHAHTRKQAPQSGKQPFRFAIARRSRGNILWARHFWGDAQRCNRWPFNPVIHLIANDPDLATVASRHKIGTATGKVSILLAIGNCAIGKIAIVQANNHPKALVTKGAIVPPRGYSRVCA